MPRKKAEIANFWIEERKNNKGETVYRARVSYFDELTHSLRKKSTTISKNTPQSRKRAQKLLLEKIQKEYDSFGTFSLSLKDLRDKYFDFIGSNKSGLHYQTGYQYESHINLFLKDVDGSILADEIKTQFLNKYFDQMFANGKSWSNVNVRKSAIYSMYQFGVDYGYCQNNPLLGYKLRREQAANLEKTENKYFTGDELRKILQSYIHAKRYDMVNLIEFIYFTGLRIGEAVALHPDDIIKIDDQYFCKVDGTQILIHNSKKPPKSNVPFKERTKQAYKKTITQKQDFTKSKNGMRFVKLGKPAVEIYKRSLDGNDFLFHKQLITVTGLRKDTLGQPFQAAAVNKLLKRTAKKCEIQKNITTHFLRHTYVSREASYGVSFDYDFIRQIGHKDAKITHEIYDHINTINHEKLKKGYLRLDKDIILHKL